MPPDGAVNERLTGCAAPLLAHGNGLCYTMGRVHTAEKEEERVMETKEWNQRLAAVRKAGGVTPGRRSASGSRARPCRTPW